MIRADGSKSESLELVDVKYDTIEFIIKIKN